MSMFDDSRNNFKIGLYSVDKLRFTASDMDSKRIPVRERSHFLEIQNRDSRFNFGILVSRWRSPGSQPGKI